MGSNVIVFALRNSCRR